MKALALSDLYGRTRFVAAQYQYSLVERNVEQEFSELCSSEGLGLVPWGPLGGGFLSGKYQPGQKPEDGRLAMMADETEEAWHRRANERNWAILQAVDDVAKTHQATYSQISLAWLMRQPTVSSVIMGVRTMAQLDDNLAASQISLTDEQLNHLDEASKPEEPYPYRFIKVYGSRKPNPEG